MRLGRFLAIFSEAEELKLVFGIPDHIRGKKLRSFPRFVAHTDLFVDTFDFVIRNLDGEEANPLLTCVGF